MTVHFNFLHLNSLPYLFIFQEITDLQSKMCDLEGKLGQSSDELEGVSRQLEEVLLEKHASEETNKLLSGQVYMYREEIKLHTDIS